MVNKLIDGVTFLKSKFQTEEIDEKLNQAVSQENWQASTQLLHEVANASYNYEKQQKILAFVWEKLKHKSWKKVLKTLHLVDFLMKYGPTSITTALKENIYEFRNFDNYTLNTEGVDRGESIRKQSRVIVDLLSDDHFLSDERAKAKQIKERMANVIGSSVYYGSFSSDGITSGNAKRETTYDSFGSNSNTFGANSPYGGLSFGESVMKTLNQSKKVEDKVQPIPTYSEKPANRLNFTNMNEKKPEESKKIFNNLSLKLVKPPQKKPAQKKIENSPSPQTVKTQPKPTGKVNIMDLDFLSFPETSQQKRVEVKTNDNYDAFDFLSASQPSSSQNRPKQTLKQNTDFNKPLNTGISNSNQLPQHNPNHQIPPNFSINQNSYSNSFGAVNYTQAQKPITNNQTSFGKVSNIPINPPQGLSISLSIPQEPKLQSSSASSNLIDFSNFRQELNQIGHQQQKSIVEQWNW